MTNEVVKLTEAESEQEAAIICGYLESRGIRATYDKGGVFQPLAFLPITGVGRQEVLVRAEDLERAKAALADAGPNLAPPDQGQT
jgi:hypothetical protein